MIFTTEGTEGSPLLSSLRRVFRIVVKTAAFGGSFGKILKQEKPKRSPSKERACLLFLFQYFSEDNDPGNDCATPNHICLII